MMKNNREIAVGRDAVQNPERTEYKIENNPASAENLESKPTTAERYKMENNQALAVQLVHPNIIVSAGAGTGKTESMTSRVVRNILEGASISEVLVLTFTNNAAEEMKGRIEEKLRKEIAGIANPAEKQRILAELSDIDHAHIQTFHSFCSDLIREYHHKSEISPDFYVLSELERKELLEEAFDEVFERIAAKGDSGDFRMTYAWYCHMDSAGKPVKLMESVLKLLGIAEGSVDFEAAVRAMNPYRKDCIPKLEDALDRHLADMERDTRSDMERYACFVKYAPDFIVQKTKKVTAKQFFATKLEDFDIRLSAALEGREPDRPNASYIAARGTNTVFDEILGVSFGGETFPRFEDFYAASRELAKKINGGIADLWELYTLKSGLDQDLDIQNARFGSLAHLILSTKQRYAKKKTARNALDFSDQEHIAFSLLCDEEVGAAVTDRFRFVFVDENQDTAEIQEQIVAKVSGKADLFKVGDIKQSIYGFRNASPEIFERQMKDALLCDVEASDVPPAETLAETKRVRIPLNFNFRTVQPILDVVNTIFSEEMGDLYENAELKNAHGKRGGEAVTPIRLVEIIPAPPSVPEAGATPADGMTFLGAASAPLPAAAPPSLPSAEEYEAEYVAKEILRIREKEAEIHGKPSDFKDFAVLHRNKGNFALAYQKVFASYGIPMEVQIGSELVEFPEVKMVLAAVRGILNPYLDVDFAAALMSPFFGFTSDDMAKLRASDRRRILESADTSPRSSASSHAAAPAPSHSTVAAPVPDAADRSFYAILQRASHGELPECDENLREKIRFALSETKRLRTYSHYLTAYEFIWKLYDLRSYFDGMLQYAGGAYRQENLLRFADLLRHLNLSIGEYAEKLRRGNPDDASKISEETDAVKLITFHKSKGMGFPHVFLGGLNHSYNFNDLRGEIIHVGGYGAAFKTLKTAAGEDKPSAIYGAMKAIGVAEVHREELRVMYVAMTRAKQSLTICFVRPKTAVSRHSHLSLLLKHRECIPFEEAVLEVSPSRPSRIADIVSSVSSAADPASLKASPCAADLKRESSDGAEAGAGHKSTFAPPFSAEAMRRKTLADTIPVEPKIPRFGERNYAQEYGTKCHLALESFDFKTLRRFYEFAETNPTGSPQRSAEDQEHTAALNAFLKEYKPLRGVFQFLKSDLAKRIAFADEVYKEADYVDFTEEGKKQGVIDLFFVEGTEITLVDYKTDVYETEEDVSRIRERHRTQLMRYKALLEKVYARPVREVYLYLLHGEGRAVRLDG